MLLFCFVVLQVETRDTLNNIALKFDTTPNELVQLNKLFSRAVCPGQVWTRSTVHPSLVPSPFLSEIPWAAPFCSSPTLARLIQIVNYCSHKPLDYVESSVQILGCNTNVQSTRSSLRNGLGNTNLLHSCLVCLSHCIYPPCHNH